MKSLSLSLGIILTLSSLGQALAQDLPTSQPRLLTIHREQVKVGRSAEHSKFEAGWPAAFEKAKSTNYYLAITSLTGPSEAWYLIASESHAAIDEMMKREQKDPVLSAEMNRLALADAEYISAHQTIRAIARPELSFGDFPDLAKARFFQISTFRLRLGREQQFEEVAKAYASAMKRVAPKASYRIYQVLAGMPQPTLLVFSSAEKYAEFDDRLRDSSAMLKQATAEEKAAFQRFGDVAESVETNHYRVDPRQSYVSKETRDKDPEFWTSK